MDDRIPLSEIIATLADHTGWSLEYILGLPAHQASFLYNRFSFKESLDRYNSLYGNAMVVATLASSKERHYHAKDIIGQPPEYKEIKFQMETKVNTITLSDGNTYELSPITLNMMVEMEDKFDMSWSSIFTKRESKGLRHLLYLRIRSKYPNVEESEIGKLVTADIMKNIAKVV